MSKPFELYNGLCNLMKMLFDREYKRKPSPNLNMAILLDLPSSQQSRKDLRQENSPLKYFNTQFPVLPSICQ